MDDAYSITALILLGCGVVAAFFKDKIIRNKEYSDEKAQLLKIINENRDLQNKTMHELELRINNILAANNVKVDLFWNIVQQRIPGLLIKQEAEM